MLQPFNLDYKNNGISQAGPNTFCFLEPSDYLKTSNRDFVASLRGKNFYSLSEHPININDIGQEVLFIDATGRPLKLDYFEILWQHNRTNLINSITAVDSEQKEVLERIYFKYLIPGITRLEGLSEFFSFDDDSYKAIEIKPVNDFYKSNIFSEFVYGSGFDKKYDDEKSTVELIKHMTHYIDSLDDGATEHLEALGTAIKSFVQISYKAFFCEEFHGLAQNMCQKYLSIYEQSDKEVNSIGAYNILKGLMMPMMPLIHSKSGCLRQAKEGDPQKRELMDYIQEDFAPNLARVYLEKNIDGHGHEGNIQNLKQQFYFNMVAPNYSMMGKKLDKKDNSTVIDLNKGILSPLFMSLAKGFGQSADALFSKIYSFYFFNAAKALYFYSKLETSDDDIHDLKLGQPGPLLDMYIKLKFLLNFNTSIKIEEPEVDNDYGNNIIHLLFASMPISRDRFFSEEEKEFDRIKAYLDKTSSWHLLKVKNQKGITPLDILNKRKYFSFDEAAYRVDFGAENKLRSAMYDCINSLTDKNLLSLEIKTPAKIGVDKNHKI